MTRGRQTDRQTEQTDRQQTDRQATDRRTDRRDRQQYRLRPQQTDSTTDRQIRQDRQTDRQIVRMDRQRNHRDRHTDRHTGRPRTDQRNPPADGGPRIDQVNPPDDRRQEEGPNSLPPLDTLHFTLMWDGQKQTMRIPGDKVNRMPSMEGSFEVLQQRAEVRWKENGASLEDAYERQAVVLKPSVLRKNTAACALSPNKKTQTQT